MTKIATYVEIDVPQCTLTYGSLPCHARLEDVSDPTAVIFNGTSAYLTRGAGLTGAADSKLVTLSGWFKFNDLDALYRIVSTATTVAGATVRFRAHRGSNSNAFEIVGTNSAGTEILRIESSVLLKNTWYHVLFSCDLSNTSKRHLYINDVSDLFSIVTYTNDTIDFTLADWAIGGQPDASNKFSGTMADLWIAPGVYIDFSVESNRRKFITADRHAVNLGATGNTPTGTAPLLFFSGAVDSWHTNDGTGGGMTLHGGLDMDLFATGLDRCYQTRSTCQSIETIDEADVTLRFGQPSGFLSPNIECVPSLLEVRFTPATISPGVDLGQRASVSMVFEDQPHSDAGPGFDPYWQLRDYNPYEQGTLWGKLRARQPYLVGKKARLIRGTSDQALEDMQRWHFFVESYDGPTVDLKFTLIAKDVLKFLDGDRAQVPPLSQGSLNGSLTISATSFTLSPTGIGSTYRTSGYANLGGSEIVSYTRSGDTMTIVRAQLGSVASAHAAQDRVQEVLYYNQEDVAVIIDDILSYTSLPSSYIDLAAWQVETATYLARAFTGVIPEPASAKDLITELIRQAALNLFDDNVNEQLVLKVLHGIPDAFTFDEDNVAEGSMMMEDQPEKRRSQIWIFYGVLDPTKGLSDANNFRSSLVLINEDSDRNYGTPMIEKIYSRWIPQLGATIAERTASILLARYSTAPRRFTYSLGRDSVDDPQLGLGYLVDWHNLQSASGARDPYPVQLTRVTPGPSRFEVEAEEIRFTAVSDDVTQKPITIDFSSNNLNMRTVFDTLYTTINSGDTVVCHILSGVVIGSSSVSSPAFDVGSWPSGVTLELIVDGTIRGKGGNGGAGGTRPAGPGPDHANGSPGQNGGVALLVGTAITMSGSGTISGGAGGGGGGGTYNSVPGGGGGGGAGTNVGTGGVAGTGSIAASPGASGTDTTGGSGGAGAAFGSVLAGAGGSGGGPGQNGTNGGTGTIGGSPLGGTGGTGGSAGASISGVGNVTGGAGVTKNGPQI